MESGGSFPPKYENFRARILKHPKEVDLVMPRKEENTVEVVTFSQHMIESAIVIQVYEGKGEENPQLVRQKRRSKKIEPTLKNPKSANSSLGIPISKVLLFPSNIYVEFQVENLLCYLFLLLWRISRLQIPGPTSNTHHLLPIVHHSMVNDPVGENVVNKSTISVE